MYICRTRSRFLAGTISAVRELCLRKTAVIASAGKCGSSAISIAFATPCCARSDEQAVLAILSARMKIAFVGPMEQSVILIYAKGASGSVLEVLL
jgi:hypothetical protein